MQASETKIRQLIEGTKQYVVPLFQRPYSWSEKQWKTLWNDVVEKAKHPDSRPHFFGSIVTTPAKSVPQGVGKFLLIDGQQRLTTVMVLLAAIRDVAASINEMRLRDRILGQYLVNSYETDDDRWKVLPTQDDRAAFRAIIGGQPIPDGRLCRCYTFFRSKLDQRSAAELEAIHLASVDRLSIVSITCDEHDNPHLIFESLNAKGEKLTPADLIRNFLLMRVHVRDQTRLYETYWHPIQQALDANLTEFVRHYLMKEGRILREAEVYLELTDRLVHSTPEQAQDFLVDLHRHGLFYARFLQPQIEGDRDIGDRLDRIRRLKVTVVYPFLLRVFDAFDRGELDRAQILETLDLIESFVIRRAVCGVQSNQLRRMFPPVFDAAGGPGPDFLDGLRQQLGGRRCPDDSRFAAEIATRPLYTTADQNARLRLILERLERSYQHKEPADLSGATIEHVLPQTLTQAWLAELGENAEVQWSQVVHRLGNLTLSAYNAELSNRPFADKRAALAKSHFVLNQYFSGLDRWTAESIRQRGEILAQQAIQVWPDVGRGSSTVDREKLSGLRPTAVRFRDSEKPCRNWRDGYIKLVQFFNQDQPNLLSKLADDGTFVAVISRDPNRFERARSQIDGVYINTHASAMQLREWLKKLASLGGYSEAEYQFVVPESTPDGELA